MFATADIYNIDDNKLTTNLKCFPPFYPFRAHRLAQFLNDTGGEVISFIDMLTSDDRENVFIADDTLYEKKHSRKSRAAGKSL